MNVTKDEPPKRVRVREFNIAMQRCPYIHEMKERLLSAGEITMPVIQPVTIRDSHARDNSREHGRELNRGDEHEHVGTIVKLNSDGYGSHISPARAPIVKQEECELEICNIGDSTVLLPVDYPHYRGCCAQADRPPKNAKTSLFIITSFIYAKLLVVICIAYVISDVITHSLPLYYYEGFFTYLYGMSILFLLYVFCFLLQESTCCNGSPPKPKPPPKEKKQKKEKEKKPKEKKKEKEGKDAKKEGKDKDGKAGKDKKEGKDKDKDGKKQSHQEVYPRKMRDKVREQQYNICRAPFRAPEQVPPPVVPPPQVPPPQLPPPQQDIIEVDVEVAHIPNRRRKTSQNDHSHGSFFLRIGAIAFGLGTMIYTGLEFGTFFEVPFTSPCYMILRGVNPLLQMIFTFMQMYFIFMNSRLNIHRFKVIARFGLMHVVATNLCVWIRTMVIESMKEITQYQLLAPNEDGIKRSTLRRGGKLLGSAAASVTTAATTLKAYAGKQIAHAVTTEPTTTTTTPSPYRAQSGYLPTNKLLKAIKSTVGYGGKMGFRDAKEPWSNDEEYSTPATSTLLTTNNPVKELTTKISEGVDGLGRWLYTTANTYIKSTIESTTPTSTTSTTLRTTSQADIWGLNSVNTIYRVDEPPHSADSNATEVFESFDGMNPAALVASAATNVSQSCGRTNIMGTIVQDSAPYLYPFIIEYSLIGAAVIYVMWKHIGSSPSTIGDEDLERRLEAVLSRRAAALAAARRGNRVDCAGASKGLFCGLLLLVAALICLILFFVLVRHPKLGLLAIYLADVSHCGLMALSILAIFIGFIRVQSLKFRSEDQSDLNDILLRVSAFGLFTYAVFSVIAGSLGAFTNEPNLLVMITGILTVVQVVLQLLFIADVSRRRVHLPEQERSKPARQVVTFLLICNLTMWLIYTFEAQKVVANPVQLDFYGFLAWSLVQRITLPLCIFHRFHSAVTLAEIWKTSYKARLE